MDHVVVLNFHGREDTLACVASLLKGSPDAQVLVVDNGSFDGTLDEVGLRWPQVATLQTGENLGFAGGMNAGLRWCLHAGAATVTVLNNDTLVPPGAIAQLAGTVTNELAVSPEVLYADGSERVWFGGGTIDRETSLARHLSDDEIAARDGRTVPTLRPTEVLAGCCVTATAEVWRRVGLFDEDYFLNFEDSQWSIRATAAGVRLAVATDVVIRHKVSASFVGAYSYLGAFYFTRNGLLFGATARPGRPSVPLRFLRRHILPTFKPLIVEANWAGTARMSCVIGAAIGSHMLGWYGRAPSWLEQRTKRWAEAA